MSNTGLLIRHAEAMYWFARYMERIEGLARVVDIHTVLAREIEGRHNWVSILQLYAWLKAFDDRGLQRTAERITHFSLLDERNPGSVISCLKTARENARILRARLSTEVWNQVNRMNNWMRTLGPDDLRPLHLPTLCSQIQGQVQTHTGVLEGTLIRDAAWSFYQLGRQIERCDQTTRILDTKYHILLPSLADVDTDFDHNQWSNLLRSLGAYHAFQRRVQGVKDARSVGRFLLFDLEFPRSVGHCILILNATVEDLRRQTGLSLPADVHETLDTLMVIIQKADIEETVNFGLHEFLDGIQKDLIKVHNALATVCFQYGEVSASQTQQA